VIICLKKETHMDAEKLRKISILRFALQLKRKRIYKTPPTWPLMGILAAI